MKPTILIVDDSITVRMDLKESLEGAGFETLLCATAALARDALQRRSFDLVILDVILPDIDGIEFLREIKGSTSTRDIPVMLLSSESEVRDRIRGLKKGADEYLGKPYNSTQVVSRARELVRRNTDTGREKPLILIIDDSVTFRLSLAETLQENGYDVGLAESGEEGLLRAADLRPDILIVDQQLPGMDGAEVLRRVRLDAALRRIPCLFLTASRQAKSELKALEAGADAFVSKDGDPAVVLAKLAALLRPGRASSQWGNASSLLGPKRILAVDDSLTYLSELAEELRQEGYDVVSAASGEEALELLAVQSVDAILLDFMMPGLSGKETCQMIKAHPSWRDVPLMILTALDERDAMLESINAGADDYITKSSEFDVLKARLRAQLRRRQFEDENRVFREQLLRREMEALEVQAVRELAETRATHISDLQIKNEELLRAKEEAEALTRELESFSYSVSHDLRAPLRSIDGFSRALQEDCAPLLDARGRGHLDKVCAATHRMENLIDDMLALAKVSRKELYLSEVDLSAMTRQIAERIQARDKDRVVDFEIQEGLIVHGDQGLLQILMENLIGNAWKFTSKCRQARIEFFSERKGSSAAVFAVRDNGAGFDMEYSKKLFGVFQRLHSEAEFPGTGVGLATAQRVLRRHGGRIWAEAQPGQGATFQFSL